MSSSAITSNIPIIQFMNDLVNMRQTKWTPMQVFTYKIVLETLINKIVIDDNPQAINETALLLKMYTKMKPIIIS